LGTSRRTIRRFPAVFAVASALLKRSRPEMPMIQALFNAPNYAATKRMLDATVLRHEAIASNLANVETPGYKRVDVAPSFAAELRSALQAGDTARLARTRPTLAVDAAAVAANRDGNTVRLEEELVQLSQNSFAHSLETQLITGTLLKLRMAITGRAN
jgi:flagellar basal-body rod protein FlgB